MKSNQTDIAIVGAGAAGLMAAIHAGRAWGAPSSHRIVALDGADRIGAKILVSGGGRCNVTNVIVDERAFSGSSSKAIRNVLRHFDVAAVIDFFRELGVELKEEEHGKLFPVTDSARSVLDALLFAARKVGVEIRPSCRIETIEWAEAEGGFRLTGEWGMLMATRVILATGGKSLPKTGSDGHGYSLVRSLGHHNTGSIFPALVPLTLPDGHFLRSLAGITHEVTLEVRASSGKRLAAVSGALLCTHFGISGPAPLDVSRHLIQAQLEDADAQLIVNWLPDETQDSIDRVLLKSAANIGALGFLRDHLPERLARALLQELKIEAGTRLAQLNRDQRRTFGRALTELPLPIAGHRGFKFAEVTAGGVPLSEVQLKTMESRACPGLYLCGEILDVDGKIGGYNFQWAWSSGYTAGNAAAQASATNNTNHV